MKKAQNLIGMIFGRLTVIRRSDDGIRWHCQCACGNTNDSISGNLRYGKSKSCGCLQRELAANLCRKSKYTHGHAAGKKPTREYRTWVTMNQRCYNESSPDYPNYGGRGITVCERWRESFQNFLDDMGNRPAGKSLDRFPNKNGNYEPSNCRWATHLQQNWNRRTNIYVTYMGETLCLAEMCEKHKKTYQTIVSRLRRGWNIELAMTKPVAKYKRAGQLR